MGGFRRRLFVAKAPETKDGERRIITSAEIEIGVRANAARLFGLDTKVVKRIP